MDSTLLLRPSAVPAVGCAHHLLQKRRGGLSLFQTAHRNIQELVSFRVGKHYVLVLVQHDNSAGQGLKDAVQRMPDALVLGQARSQLCIPGLQLPAKLRYLRLERRVGILKPPRCINEC
jgi:hypothetical protein